ncbi:MAG: hypothetical protein ACPGJS_15080 [Flammeovirgaceae bacterium]
MSKRTNWQPLLICLLIPFLFAFGKPEKETAKEKAPEGVWTIQLMPTGVNKVHDVVFWSQGTYFATNKGIYKADLLLNTPRNNWPKVQGSQATFTDLQVQIVAGVKTEILAYAGTSGQSGIFYTGSIKKNSPNQISARERTTGRIQGLGMVGSLAHANCTFVLNGATDVMCMSTSRNCRSLTAFQNGRRVNGTMTNVFGYMKNKGLIIGGSGPFVYVLDLSGQICDNSWKVKSYRFVPNSVPPTGSVVQFVSDETSYEVFAATSRGYIYRSTNGGKTWKYYAHGLKPQDDPTQLYSMVTHRDKLYISTNRGLFFTSKTGVQADWKPYSGLPGWRNKRVNLYTSAIHLIAEIDGITYKRQLN